MTIKEKTSMLIAPDQYDFEQAMAIDPDAWRQPLDEKLKDRRSQSMSQVLKERYRHTQERK